MAERLWSEKDLARCANGRPAVLRHAEEVSGKVGRSHRIDAEKFYRLLDGVVLGDIGVFNEKLKEWEDYHNYHRPRASTTRGSST